jgi:uncharacterized protein YjbI with pentapeptide repeats
MVKFSEPWANRLFSKDNLEVVKTGAESVKTSIEVVKAIQEKKGSLKEIQPYLGQISSLLDVLSSPWAQVVKEAIPFAPLAMTVLNLTCEHLKRESSLEECIVVAAQAAYMQSWEAKSSGILKQNPDRFKKFDLSKSSKEIDRKLQKLGDKEINLTAAIQIITALPSSELVQEFNEILIDRLIEYDFKPLDARNFAEQVARDAPLYVEKMLAEHPEKIKALAELRRTGGQEVLARYVSIGLYLEEKIEPLPLEPVFGEENLQLQDIYVTLDIQSLDANGEVIEESQRSIEDWAIEKLDDPKSKKILFIQGEAGRGKSAFCRMFAAELVRRQSTFRPILIRLRDILRLGDTFVETIEKHLGNFEFIRDTSWRTNKNQRFLFLLDGFDELILQGKSPGLKDFIEKIENFQRDSHHRILITGRPLAMNGIDGSAFWNKSLERVKFLPMDKNIRTKWLEKWSKKFEVEETNKLIYFVRDCPDDIKNDLAREPLILYVMARMHRDGAIKVADLISTSVIGAKVKIYDRTIAWVLKKQHEELNEYLNKNKNRSDSKLEIDKLLRQLLTEVAVCVIQSGNEFAKIETIDHRLTQDTNNNLKELFEKISGGVTDNEKVINNLLTSFYIQQARVDRDGSVEFAHKSFGEFLFAERIKKAICDWSSMETVPVNNRKSLVEVDRVDRAKLEWQIYDLLGSSFLTPDIVKYLEEMLIASTDDWQPEKLFERLNEFWENWCDGVFIDNIDRPTENLPQKKMNTLVKQMPDRELRLGIRQVDVFAGLNVLILLLELHRYAQSRDELKDSIVFYPSGEASSDRYKTRLLNTIYYSDSSIGIGTFYRNLRFFLSGANLNGANFNGANFNGANLNGVNFNGADLSGADLSGARLNGAKFNHANVNGVNFNGADLSGADLNGADLNGADLRGAHLRGANFNGANFNGANFNGANFNGANLNGANFNGAELNGANFNGAELNGANFNGAELNRAKLLTANLKGGNLSGADLRGANLSSADLSSATLSSADLSSATLNGADLNGADLSGADLSGAKLNRAKLSGANLSGANLSGAILNSAYLNGANLNGADLSGARLNGADLNGAELNLAELNLAELNLAELNGVKWDKSTNWTDAKGLETAIDLPAELKQHLGL